eukprot:TRINITY_DN408_c1_g1_i1.p1 TRINITY_DN408_c1_g1~~TRINITY_DN408_c1_g1_i1.p1  ORF type:complete len:1111 (+),score=146.05 TRINITY_DN408_c1_g1_i1:87-3419(+)
MPWPVLIPVLIAKSVCPYARYTPVAAEMSSIMSTGCKGDKCIDGVTACANSCSPACHYAWDMCHSAIDQPNQWLRLDLGASVPVNCVDIYNREDGLKDRLGVHEIWAGSSTAGPTASGNTQCASFTGSTGSMALITDPTTTFPCTGQYVFVYLPGASRTLNLVEVQVFGPSPTASPSASPSVSPTVQPSRSPTLAPSRSPSVPPTGSPSRSPSVPPSRGPSRAPSLSPTRAPSLPPTAEPSVRPSAAPTLSPLDPTVQPSTAPTRSPSLRPTAAPTRQPSRSPSAGPTRSPSTSPTRSPTAAPSVPPTLRPTVSPSATPTTRPSASPTTQPTVSPTAAPSRSPSLQPTTQPTTQPSVSPTAAPSVAPSKQPTAQPSVSPTTSPSQTPTASPTVAPSLTPTAQPTSTPSASPTASPSLPPTREPTAQPSTPPSRRPSAAPTLHPSATPSATPTRQPSALPSVPPTAQPSPAPTAAPSASPSLTPSTRPSSVPSAAPTAAPSTPPSAEPSRSPTVSPAKLPAAEATSVVKGSVDAGATAAVLAASGPAAAQAGRLTVLLAGCTEDDPDYAAILHPTGVSVSSFTRPNSAGCVIMNTAIAAACGLLHFSAAKVVQRVKGMSVLEGQGTVRYPTGAVIAAVVLSQGSSFAGARVLRDAGNAGDFILGAFAVLYGFCLPLLIYREGCAAQNMACFKLDEKAKSGCQRLWLGPGEWLSLPPERYRVERWGIAFRATLPDRQKAIALDILFSQLSAVNGGFTGGSCTACGYARMIDALFAVLLLIAVGFSWPYARPLRQYFTVAAQLCLLIGAVGLGIGHLSPSCEDRDSVLPGHEMAQYALLLAGLCTLLGTAMDISATLRGAQIDRRGKLASVLERFRELDKDGSGAISKRALRQGLQEVWKREFTETEFTDLFNKVDADGSGEVDLQEFLASEHLFWDAGSDALAKEHVDEPSLLSPRMPSAALDTSDDLTPLAVSVASIGSADETFGAATLGRSPLLSPGSRKSFRPLGSRLGTSSRIRRSAPASMSPRVRASLRRLSSEAVPAPRPATRSPPKRLPRALHRHVSSDGGGRGMELNRSIHAYAKPQTSVRRKVALSMSHSVLPTFGAGRLSKA